MALGAAKRSKSEPTTLETLGTDALLNIVSFLQPNDALNLSSVSPALDAAMDKSVWRYVLLEQCGVKPKVLKPRTQLRKMVVGHVEKKTCHHCGRFVVRGLYTIDDRNEHYGKKLCMTCMEMPVFKEIGHMEALRKYKLKHHELHTLPVRLAPDGYYTYDYEPPMKKMYNLQVVLNLVAQLR